MKYTKINVQGNRLQIGIDSEGNSFLRFSNEESAVDIILGSGEAIYGLSLALEAYIEEMTPSEEIH